MEIRQLISTNMSFKMKKHKEEKYAKKKKKKKYEKKKKKSVPT